MKETLDILVLMRSIAAAIDRARQDGRIDWFDLPQLAALKEYASDAIRGSQDIPAELLDLDIEEVKILLSGLLEAIQKLSNAIVGK